MRKSIGSKKYNALLIWLKETRVQRDLSMRDVGDIIAEPHSWVGKIESGERRLDVGEYVEYCRLLNIDPLEGIAILQQ